MLECRKCQRKPEAREVFDYCARCGWELCLSCMKSGHCSFKPAQSGSAYDKSAQIQMWGDAMEREARLERMEGGLR